MDRRRPWRHCRQSSRSEKNHAQTYRHQTILIIGAGPIIIGQACEFDYSGAQACKALREEGYKVVWSTQPGDDHDRPETADVTYIEPITWQVVENHRKRAPDAVLPTMGGRPRSTAPSTSPSTACSKKYGVELIGATPRPSTRPRTA